MKIVFVVACALCASVAMAAPASVGAVAAPDAAQEKKICRTMEPAIGSNMIKRVCKTRAEWAEQHRQSPGDRVDLDKFRDTTTQFAAPR